MVHILYTRFDAPLPPEKYHAYLDRLPRFLQDKIARFKRWQDRHASLFGKLLLQQGLTNTGHSMQCLERLRYEEHNRPFIDASADFNISHSHEYVICVIAGEGRAGIDIEHIRPIALEDFQTYMTHQEWAAIKTAPQPYEKFFDYWSIKESVMKADGRGLFIPLPDIEVCPPHSAMLYGVTWFTKKLDIASEYACHLAINRKNVLLDLKEIEF
ncbi:MAG: 4'-phosphopantetheinyl transferase superfamily protein [Gammaproteobacteria bacterium]|nr:4'-phosphopantetheinyl transferase superfamily protein [Gammaproteobacteria bacterium]